MEGRPRWRVGTGCVAVVAIVAGISACGGSRASDDDGSTGSESPVAIGPGQRHGASPPVVGRLPERLRTEFALFRSPPEGLPTRVGQVLGSRPMYGMNPSLAQAISGAPWPAWVVPGRGFVCLLYQQSPQAGVGQACTIARRVVVHGVFAATLAADRAEPGRRVVFGVVPDGARTVHVHTPGFASASAPVRGNVFALRDRTSEPPEAITLAP